MRPRNQLAMIFLALCITVLSACAIGSGQPTATRTQEDASKPVNDFTNQLTLALIQHDYSQLQEMMGDTFTLALWRAEGVTLPPAVAVVQLRNNYLIPGRAVAFPDVLNLADRLDGADPLGLWGADVNAAKAILVAGLGPTGQDEAMLIVATKADGAPYWFGLLAAPGGFQVEPEQITALPTTAVTTTVTAVATTVTAPATTAPTPPTVEATATPTVGTAQGPQRLQFAQGATAISVHDIVQPPVEKQFVLRAAAGQVMSVELLSAGGIANFSVTGVTDRRPLKRLTNESRIWSSALPATQDYLIAVAGLSPVAFELRISIPVLPATATPTVAAETTPERINFASGATSASVIGTLTFPARKQYLLRAAGGQIMTVAIRSPENLANFAVQGVTDGQPLKRLENEDRTWSGELPMNQDYLITVAVPSDSANYTLDVSVVEPTSDEPEQIEFGAGETSATRSGNVVFPAQKYYLLRALADQQMTVEIQSPDDAANFAITGVSDGQPYKRLVNEDRIFTFLLPSTQDYLITVATAADSSDYMLTVTVITLPEPEAMPERINFAPGAVSATRSGSFAPGSVKQYILNAAAGQQMDVRTNGYQAPVRFVIESPSGSTWEGEAQGSEVYIFAQTITLPENGDYLITVSTPGDAATTDYDLVVTIESMGPPPAEKPERVNFAAGAISAVRPGVIRAGVNLKEYILGAGAGQMMEVTVRSNGAPIDLVVRRSAGGVMLAQSGGVSAINQVTATLPMETDYVVMLSTAHAAPDTTFTVEFVIR